jgi:hypothetical protein
MVEESVNKFLRTVFTEELAEADADDDEDDELDDDEEDEEDDAEAGGGCIGGFRWLGSGDLERGRFGVDLSLLDWLPAFSLSVGIGSFLSLRALSSF